MFICSTHCISRFSIESVNNCNLEPLRGVESYLRWIRQRNIINAIKVWPNKANINRTDPLVAALSDFQKALSVEQKAKLLAINTAPDAFAVLQFTSDLDRSNARRRSRCVAGRLQNTLQSVQQFTTIVDTFVSSSPTIAALVWGSLKVTILVSLQCYACSSHG